MKPHYRETTRIEMERAGRALPKKDYRCVYCSRPGTHDEMYRHQMNECPQRPGSTVKAPK